MKPSLTLQKVMKQNDVADIETLLILDEEELLKLKGVGEKTLAEIESFRDGEEDTSPPEWDDTVVAPNGDTVVASTGEIVPPPKPKIVSAEDTEPAVTLSATAELTTDSVLGTLKTVQSSSSPRAETTKSPDTEFSGVRAGFEAKREKDTNDIGDSLLELEEQAYPILDEIKLHTMKARQAMDLEPIPLQVLANEQVELSILLQRLSERIAMAGYVARAAENHLDVCRENYKIIFVEEGKAAGVADSMKKLEAQEEFEIYNQAKRLFDNINLTRKSTDKTIDTLRSKLSFEKVAERG